ncbi:hypothetical protein D3C75_1264400 [compost metagenome]
MPAGEDHHPERDNTDNQPQGAVFVGDHHIVAEHSPHHHRDPDQQRHNGLPAVAFHGGDSGLMLALTAFDIILNRLCAVARFFNRQY